MTTPDNDATDNRSIDLEVEVPGTPEQVWEAIATGPGITAWMHPTEVEEREGGSLSFDMGAGMTMSGKVAGWDPPGRFVEESDWEVEGAPKVVLATEWVVEARGGGTCVVRMVTSGFGPESAWDEEIEGFTEAMQGALGNLRLYLTHFPGEHGTWMRVFGRAPGSVEEGWAELAGALGLAHADVGSEVNTSDSGAPEISGVVEGIAEGKWQRFIQLRIDEPAPGLASVAIYGQAASTTVQACFYRDEGAQVAAREEPAWRDWMQAQFPADE